MHLITLAQHLYDGASSEACELINAAHALDNCAAPNIPKLKDPELARLIIECLTAEDATDEYDKPSTLLAVAQQQKIDIKIIRAEVVKEIKAAATKASK